jgi:fructosamine-3-kinase
MLSMPQHGKGYIDILSMFSFCTVIFDPASFYGHHEFELGIAGMFGGFSAEFYNAYRQLIPKAAGFDERHKLYQLFHYLNHW